MIYDCAGTRVDRNIGKPSVTAIIESWLSPARGIVKPILLQVSAQPTKFTGISCKSAPWDLKGIAAAWEPEGRDLRSFQDSYRLPGVLGTNDTCTCDKKGYLRMSGIKCNRASNCNTKLLTLSLIPDPWSLTPGLLLLISLTAYQLNCPSHFSWLLTSDSWLLALSLIPGPWPLVCSCLTAQ